MIKKSFFVLLIITTPPAFAYVGPGFAGGIMMTVLGLVAAIIMLLVGVIWYPLKKLIRFFRTRPVVRP